MNIKGIASIFVGASLFGINLLPLFPAKCDSAPVPQSQLSWHEALHQPVVNGKRYKVTPYLTLPFRHKDVKNYDIYQGFIYSADELKIHRSSPIHAGVDYELPYGTPVVAPADGYAMSSYLTSYVKDPETKENKLYKGKPIRYGFGYFVRMYIPSMDRYIDLAHMSDIDPAIPFSPPVKVEDGWNPTNNNLKREEWTNSPYTVFVKRGTVLGKVGYSGLGWGTEEEWKEGAIRPVVTGPNVFKSWDRPHIHFEEFGIDQETGLKGWHRDPYAIYDTYDYYPTSQRNTCMGKDPLFILDKNKLPKYVDDYTIGGRVYILSG